MKTMTISIIFLMTMISIGQAQTTTSAFTGPTFYNVNVNGISNQILPKTVLKPGVQVGIEIEKSLDPRLSFISGISYSEKGFTAKEGFNVNLLKVPIKIGMKAVTELKYIEAPIGLKYKLTSSNNFTTYTSLGLVTGYLIDADIKTKASAILDFNISQHDINLNSDLYNRWELGARGGLGVATRTDYGQFYMEGSVQLGITDMLKDPIVDIRLKNQGFQLKVGYTYTF
jgi:hypothetical protein